MSVNPNIPAITQPLATPEANTRVILQLRQAVQSLAGQLGNENDRAVTFNDLAASSKRQNSAQGQQVGALRATAQADTRAVDWVMMGFGVKLTAYASTRWFVLFQGQIGNDTNNGTSYAQVAYGTGTPPAQGAPLTGTLDGLPVYFIAPQANAQVPFSQAAMLIDLNIGQSYWIDVAIRAGLGTCILSDVEILGFGLLDSFVASL